MDYKLAKTAANWWIEAMKKQRSDLYPKEVIIDDSFSRELSRFEVVLTDEIYRCIEKQSYLSLTCCFRPNRSLSKLVDKAQVSMVNLPHQATMQIYGSSIEVSLNGEKLRKLPLPAK